MNEPPTRRPRNAALTKERILQAAHAAFARSGYSGVSLRQIAADAGVTSALLVRYFGTKAGLFEAALIWTVENRSTFTYDKPLFGETMAAAIRDRNNIDITAMLVLALADPETQGVAARLIHDRMIVPLAQWLGPPDADARAMSLFALLTGFAVQVRAPTDAATRDRCLAWLARTLQAIVDQR